MLNKNFIYVFVILFIFFLDQISKNIILNLPQILNSSVISFNSYLSFTLVKNSGIAFGLLSSQNTIFYNSITAIIISIIVILFYFLIKVEGLEKISYSFIIGGSLGNLFDRLTLKYVIDFIDISINDFHWFIFNIADIFITIGIIMLISREFLTKNKNYE
jgi:signal peptidase II